MNMRDEMNPLVWWVAATVVIAALVIGAGFVALHEERGPVVRRCACSSPG